MSPFDFVTLRWNEQYQQAQFIIDLEERYPLPDLTIEWGWHKFGKSASGMTMLSSFYEGGLSPQQVVADIEAKREALAVLSVLPYIVGERIVRLFAATFSDHPDYLPEWAPEETHD